MFSSRPVLLALLLTLTLVVPDAAAAPPDGWESKIQSGTEALASGDLAAAETHLRAAWDMVKGRHAVSSPEVLRTVTPLAQVLKRQRRWQDAAPVLEIVVSGQRMASPGAPDHPGLERAVHQLAEVYRKLGALDDAEAALSKQLAAKERAYGKKHPSLIATLNDLALVHTDAKDFAKAIAACERARTLAEGAAGGLGSGIILHAIAETPAGRDLATTLHVLGAAYTASGRHAEAEPVLRDAATIASKAFGERDRRSVEVMGSWCQALHDTGQTAEAARVEARLRKLRRR